MASFPALVLLALPLLLQQAPHENAIPKPHYWTAPEVLGPHAPAIGRWIPDLPFVDLDGNPGSLHGAGGPKGLVLVVRDPDCPLSQRYAPRTLRLEEEARQLGLEVLYLAAFDEPTAKRDAERYSLEARYAVEGANRILSEIEATSTTETFVLDAAHTLVYRGMIDDQYGLGFSKPAPTHEYLTQAMRDVAAGRAVSVPATQAHGCLLSVAPREPSTPGDVTYHRRIARIIQNRCQRCHRPGTAAPFPLETYAQVRRKARMIRLVLDEGTMPPWFAAPGTGPWANDASLLPEEKRDLLAWLDSGMPEGDPSEAPRPRRWTTEWTIGEPDLIVEMDPFSVPAEGVLDYHYSYKQAALPTDRWVKAVEILPGAPSVVHHELIWLESPELFERWKRHDPEVAGEFEIIDHYYAMMVPGQEGKVYAPGFGRRLPAHSWIKIQQHYTTTGVPAVDRTRIGFVFTDEPVRREVISNIVANFKFEIPPGARRHPVVGEFTFPTDGTLLSLLPHGHLRCVAFQVELVLPDGSLHELLEIPRFDFNWQLDYEFLTPLEVPAGAVLRATGWYDNSTENPYNPDPDVAVHFGRQTWQEMMVIFFQWSPRPG